MEQAICQKPPSDGNKCLSPLNRKKGDEVMEPAQNTLVVIAERERKADDLKMADWYLVK